MALLADPVGALPFSFEGLDLNSELLGLGGNKPAHAVRLPSRRCHDLFERCAGGSVDHANNEVGFGSRVRREILDCGPDAAESRFAIRKPARRLYAGQLVPDREQPKYWPVA